jgi:hypothetical protein
MKCGHCKQRDVTVEHVQKCSGENSQTQSGMTKKQALYLSDLLSHFGLVLSGGLTPETINYHNGKRILDGLIDARRLQAVSKPYTMPDGVMISAVPPSGGRVRTPRPVKLPKCTPGYYAVADWTGKEEFRFFRVKRKANGEWKGWTFVDEVIGGHVDSQCNWPLALEAVTAILDFGMDKSAVLYALKIKKCFRCNLSLTKKASRDIGLGRECAQKRNRGQEWDDLNRNYKDADAEDDE